MLAAILSIDVLEPIYGLVGLGLVHPQRVRRNADAQAGDVLVLGKPLGVGVLSAALKKNLLDAAGYAQMLQHTTQLNRVGMALAQLDGVHAMTDVTGFGLAGHLLEVCRGSGLHAVLELARLPLIPQAVAFAQQGIATGASGRNWAAYGSEVAWPEAAPLWQRQLLTDPQTRAACWSAARQMPCLLCWQPSQAAGAGQACVVGQMVAPGSCRCCLFALRAIARAGAPYWHAQVRYGGCKPCASLQLRPYAFCGFHPVCACSGWPGPLPTRRAPCAGWVYKNPSLGFTDGAVRALNLPAPLVQCVAALHAGPLDGPLRARSRAF